MKTNIFVISIIIIVIAPLVLIYDKPLTLAFYSLSRNLDTLDMVISFVAKWMIFVLLGLTIVYSFINDKKNWWLKIGYILLAAGIAYVIAQFIQSNWDRPRPFIEFNVEPLIPHEADPSFPSDYATVSFAFAIGLLLLSFRAGIAGFVIAAVIGLARVYCCLHWFSDIFFGGILGMSSAVLLEMLFPIISGSILSKFSESDQTI